MAYTFAVDTDEIVQLKKTLQNAEDLMSSGIKDIYSEIGDMEGDVWSGDSYTDFSNGALKYESALETLPGVLKAFRTELERAEKDASPLNDSITEAINNMMNS